MLNKRHSINTVVRTLFGDDEVKIELIAGDPSISVVFETVDYSKFKYFGFNRDLDKNQVNRLKRLLQNKNLFRLSPVSVTSDFHVIDGQNRIEAARQLLEETGIPIPLAYYVSPVPSEEVSGKDIGQLQQAKAWQLHDYLKLHIQTGNPEYERLLAFKKEHVDRAGRTSLMDLKRIIGLLYSGKHFSTHRKAEEVFKDGTYEIDEKTIPFTHEVLDLIRGYEDGGVSFALNRNFQTALTFTLTFNHFQTGKKLMTLDQHHAIIKKLKTQRGFVNHGGSVDSYLKAMENYYNAGRKARNHIAIFEPWRKRNMADWKNAQ